jgi:two-component system response regulator FixJ
MTDKGLVHLVDDEESLRRSTSFVLKTSGYSVITYASGAAFLKEAAHAEPGCILLDVRMPELDGLDVQRMLHERGIAMPVIVFTGHGDISIAVQAMKLGAVDFIEKPFEKAKLLSSLEVAFDRLRDKNRQAVAASEASVRIAALTGRERDVLGGLARGNPNKTIAYDLGISPRTVEVHRANLMQKLEVRSLSDALRIAFAAGLADEGPSV